VITIADITDCPLHRKTPFGITGVSNTQFSIARHFGGITFQGDIYVYNPVTDELIRGDVLKWASKQAKRKVKPTGDQQELL